EVADSALVPRARKQAWSRESATTALATRRGVFPLERLPPFRTPAPAAPRLTSPYPDPEAAMTPRRRKDGRIVPAPEPLPVTNPHAAGIDVHAARHYVAVPPAAVPAGRPPHVRTFGAC